MATDVDGKVINSAKKLHKDDEIVLLEEICGEVKILPRQAKTSTSDKIRKIMISNQRNIIDDLDKKVEKSIEEFKKRINFDKEMRSPIPKLVDNMKNSTDWKVPVVAACYYNRRWYFGTNQSDFNIPKYDVDNRTELFYASIEHAEINLLKKMGDIEKLDVPVYTSLLPCDKCMKVLHDKGVKKIYYIEDHEHRNWSKRSHQYAKEKGMKLIKLLKDDD